MEEQLNKLFALRSAPEDIMWIDGVYVNHTENGIMCSINTSDFQMTYHLIKSFEHIHIRKLKSKGKYGKKELEYLRSHNYKIDREFATKETM